MKEEEKALVRGRWLKSCEVQGHQWGFHGFKKHFDPDCASTWIGTTVTYGCLRSNCFAEKTVYEIKE